MIRDDARTVFGGALRCPYVWDLQGRIDGSNRRYFDLRDRIGFGSNCLHAKTGEHRASAQRTVEGRDLLRVIPTNQALARERGQVPRRIPGDQGPGSKGRASLESQRSQDQVATRPGITGSGPGSQCRNGDSRRLGRAATTSGQEGPVSPRRSRWVSDQSGFICVEAAKEPLPR